MIKLIFALLITCLIVSGAIGYNLGYSRAVYVVECGIDNYWENEWLTHEEKQ